MIPRPQTSLSVGRGGRSGLEGTSLIIWDVNRSSTMHHVNAHQNIVSALATSRDNNVLASGSLDAEIVLWNVSGGHKLTRLYPDQGQSIHSPIFTFDGTKLIGGPKDGKLNICDTTTHGPVIVLERNTAMVAFFTFSPDGRFMATLGTVHVWYTALKTGQLVSMLASHKGVECMTAASDYGFSRIWSAETDEGRVVLRDKKQAGRLRLKQTDGHNLRFVQR